MLRKAFMLVSGNAFASALLLIRNLLVARLISPEDYGIAATFAISMSIVEMASYLGLQQLIVVDKDGDDPHVQAAMQGFQVMRGVLSFLLLLAISGPYARFLGIPEVAWAYQVLALIPLMNGLQHFDVHRLKRSLNFMPSVISTAVPAIVAVASLWPITWVFGDYRVMLISLLAQAVVSVVLTHLMARRPYRIAYDPAVIRKSVVFGWPLLLNGIMLFLVFNGEKLIVGRELGMAELAIFSMGFTLTLTPTLVMGSSIQTFFLPQLSAAQDRQEDFQRIGEVTLEAGLVIGVVLVLGALVVGGPLVHLLLGAKYAGMMAIIVPLAALQAIRSAKTGSSVVALARKQSGNAIVSNLFRVGSLPLSWFIAVRTGDILAIIWVGIAAEVLGYIVSLRLVQTRVGLSLRGLAATNVLTGLTYLTAVLVSRSYPAMPALSDHLHVAQLLPVALGGAALLSMGGLRRYLMRRWRARRG
jgi:O-antigen/teichoic acid export membrane protein